MKPRVLVTRRLLPEAMEGLEAEAEVEVGASGRDLTHKELLQKIKDKDGLLSLLVDTVDREVLEAAPRLRIIANCAVGINNIDLGCAREKGILVTNTPGVLTETTAELTMALILAVARRITEADRFTREGKFKGWALDLFLGRGLFGNILGIIGMGRIGRAVASRAAAFGMKILYSDPHRLEPEVARSTGAVRRPLESLLRTADVVTIHASLTEKTRRLISGERLALMKKDAILINVARGPIVDEKALADALEQGRLWGAGLDVYEREPEIEARLFGLPNVVLLPHIGSATTETRLRMALTAVRNLLQGLRGETPENLVSGP